MIMAVFIKIVLLNYLIVSVIGSNQDQEENLATVEEVDERFITNEEPFVATKEWAPVKKGQAVPPGLHIRMNMETGQVEAKLLEEEPEGSDSQNAQFSAIAVDQSDAVDDRSSKSQHSTMAKAMEEVQNKLNERNADYAYWKDGGKEGMVNTKKSFSREELKEALKKFKAEKDDVQDEAIRAESTKNKFRSMDELKHALAQLELNIQTDMEILDQLVAKYKTPNLLSKAKVIILTDVEYYVHQIDNALHFVDVGGLELVVKDLNHTDEEVRSEAAYVVGSATQSNPKVQIAAVDGGALQQLIRMLSTESTDSVKNRVLYAISSIVRLFPYAQSRFLAHGGLQALVNLFTEAGPEKLKIKAMTLVTDLVTEKFEGQSSGNEEKQKQYERMPLLETMEEQGWCGHIPKLLVATSDYDGREKIITSMLKLKDHCTYTDIEILKTLKSEYKILAKEERDNHEDMYFGKVLNSIQDLLDHVSTKDEL